MAVGCHPLVHAYKDDVSTACAWVAPCNKLKEIYQETSLHKRFLKRNLADVESMQKCTG